MKGLMIAFAFTLPYHVMRCAAAAGASVHVLGSGPSRRLRLSRYCAGFHESRFDYRSDDYDLILDEIKLLVKEQRIDLIMPSDDVSTRLLAALADRLPVRTSPVPSLDCFDTMNDKWNFARFSRDHGVRVPESWLFETAEDLRGALKSGRLALPLTVKPTNLSGGAGVLHIRDASELGQLDAVDYRPVLAQRHIDGETIGISVLCRRGAVVASVIQLPKDNAYSLFANPDLLENVQKLAGAVKLHGPANLDAVVESETGLSYIVECNPRFWYTIYMPMILGLNFVDLALNFDSMDFRDMRTLIDVRVRIHGALFRNLLKPWRYTRPDWRMLGYYLRDPLPYLCERMQLVDDHDVAVGHPLMRERARDAGPLGRRPTMDDPRLAPLV